MPPFPVTTNGPAGAEATPRLAADPGPGGAAARASPGGRGRPGFAGLLGGAFLPPAARQGGANGASAGDSGVPVADAAAGPVATPAPAAGRSRRTGGRAPDGEGEAIEPATPRQAAAAMFAPLLPMPAPAASPQDRSLDAAAAAARLLPADQRAATSAALQPVPPPGPASLGTPPLDAAGTASAPGLDLVLAALQPEAPPPAAAGLGESPTLPEAGAPAPAPGPVPPPGPGTMATAAPLADMMVRGAALAVAHGQAATALPGPPAGSATPALAGDRAAAWPAIAGHIEPGRSGSGRAGGPRLSGEVPARAVASDSSPMAAGNPAAGARPSSVTWSAAMVNVPISFQDPALADGRRSLLPSDAQPAGVPGSDARESTQPSESFADITVALDEGKGLEVRLSAAHAEAAHRLGVEIDRLGRDLAAIGSDVEAIRVELRGAAGTDGATGPGRDAAADWSGDDAAGQSEPAFGSGPGPGPEEHDREARQTAGGTAVSGQPGRKPRANALPVVAGTAGADGKVDLYG